MAWGDKSPCDLQQVADAAHGRHLKKSAYNDFAQAKTQEIIRHLPHKGGGHSECAQEQESLS